MPLRPSRLAKAAVVTAAVTPGPSPVAKAAVVGAAVWGRGRGRGGGIRSPRRPSSRPPSRLAAAASSQVSPGGRFADPR